MKNRRLRWIFGAGCASLWAVAACEPVEVVVDQYRNLTPHEAYIASLRTAGLDSTALVKDWIDASEGALADPMTVTLPFREEGWLDATRPHAVGYRVALERGQRLTVKVDLGGEAEFAPGGLFVDFFRVPEDADNPLRPVSASDTVSLGTTGDGQISHFHYDAGRDGEFVVRVQPEVLRGGTYRIDLDLNPSFAFPVEGRDENAILSFFGAPRDGGARSHHGVDIFAPRGTPVIAVVDGVVSRSNLTNIGGKVVWLHDERGAQSIYYAHLDSQVVEPGDRVQRGDTVGFVGNTGNARTTPPHLHFGVYLRRSSRRRGRGPVDPLNYVHPVRRAAADWPESDAPLGGWVRVARSGVNLRADATLRGSPTSELDAGMPLRVEGGSDAWWRVRLPDGQRGFVSTRVTEFLDESVERRVASGAERVQAAPDGASAVIAQLPPGTEVTVLARFGAFDLVEAEVVNGQTSRSLQGWLAINSVDRE